MAEVVIGVGSNLGDRLDFLKQAGDYLSSLSDRKLRKSSIWESEPVGPAEYPFLNSVALIHTRLSPADLLHQLKQFELQTGREKIPKRWGPRVLDLDIIAYDKLVIHHENLIIPHPEYRNRMFVLLPLQELRSEWLDPEDGTSLASMIANAPDIMIKKTEHIW